MEKGHGRIEKRTLETTQILTAAQKWKGLKQGLRITRERTVKGVRSVEVAYGITSLSTKRANAATLLVILRDHWQIENTLHWVLDVVFAEDQSRIHGRNAAANFAFIRKFCLSLLKREPSKGSMKAKRKRAGWNIAFLESVLFLKI